MSYEIKIENIYIGQFESWQGEDVWQALSEEPELMLVDSEDNYDRLSEWQNLLDDNIFTLLKSAKDKKFIDDYEIEEVEDEEE